MNIAGRSGVVSGGPEGFLPLAFFPPLPFTCTQLFFTERGLLTSGSFLGLK